MTRAAVEQVDVDLGRAGDFLRQARAFLADAERSETHLESAVVLYWSACISAMDAILAGAGLRVGSGTDSHMVRIETSLGVLGPSFDDLRGRLDEWRRERHDVSYVAITPSAADVAAMQADTHELVDLAATYVRRGQASDPMRDAGPA